jgi:hypothetical protein
VSDRINLAMVRGDTTAWAVLVTIVDDEGITLPLDLRSGALLAFTASDDTGTTVFAKTVGDGIVISSADPGNEVTMRLSPADTTGLGDNVRLSYDLQLTQGTDVTTILRGSLFVEADVG